MLNNYQSLRLAVNLRLEINLKVKHIFKTRRKTYGKKVPTFIKSNYSGWRNF